MTRRRRQTKAEHATARAVVQVLEPDPPRLPLWVRMQHTVGTCGGPGVCTLCPPLAAA
jgi:hypothetical protein